MNIIFTGIIIFVITFLLLSWFVKTSSKKLARGVRNLIIILSLLIAMALTIGGKILFSLPLLFLALSALKIKGLTTFQIWQIWRLLNYLRSIGRYSHFGQNNQTRPSSNLSTGIRSLPLELCPVLSSVNPSGQIILIFLL